MVRIANGSRLPVTVFLNQNSSEEVQIPSGRYLDLVNVIQEKTTVFLRIGDESTSLEVPELRNLVIGSDLIVQLTRPGCTWVDEAGKHHWICLGGHMELAAYPVIQTLEKSREIN